MNVEPSTINVLLTSIIALQAWNIGQLFALKLKIVELTARLDTLTNEK